MDPVVRATVAVLAGAALIAAGCGGSDTDRAGGREAAAPRVLTMAQPNAGLPGPSLMSWADEVSRRSRGTLEIEFANGWRLGEPAYEAGTIEDVKLGKIDMAWVGARAFDQAGVNSFQALVAPMLVDSYDLQAAVFEAGIPARMLEGLDDIELAGIGVLPGPMRKVLGVSKPFVRLADFAGAIVGMQASGMAEKTMLALGATPRAVPSSADLDGLDGLEQQLGSIVGNYYSATAEYVTANINLWPRPLVIVMARNTFESLTPEHQNALRDAADAAVPDALADSEAEDDTAIATLCRQGMTLAAASNSDIDEMRAALEPVYDQLSSDSATKAYIDTIERLKDELGVAPEVPACSPAQSSDDPTAEGFPEGTYQMTLTADDWSHGCAADPEADVPPNGVRHEVTLDDGSVQLLVEVDGTMENGYVGSYEVFRDRIQLTDALGSMSARWSFDGESLTFTDLVNPLSCGDVVVLTSQPWVLMADAEPAATSIPDGTYEMTLTRREANDGCGEPGQETEYDETLHELTLHSGSAEMFVELGGRGGRREHAFTGNYTVFRDRIEITDSGVTLSARWTFDGTNLEFADMEASDQSCGHSTIWTTHPWVLAGAVDEP